MRPGVSNRGRHSQSIEPVRATRTWGLHLPDEAILLDRLDKGDLLAQAK